MKHLFIIVEMLKLVSKFWDELKVYLHDKMIAKNISDIKEGQTSGDTIKIENAINSDIASKPTGIVGVQRRKRKD